VLPIPHVATIFNNVTVCTQGLHQSLGSTLIKKSFIEAFAGRFLPKWYKCLPFIGWVVEVRVEDKRRKIVFLATITETLEINEPNFLVFYHQILWLEVPMNQIMCLIAKVSRKVSKCNIFPKQISIHSEESFHHESEKILLFPVIEVCIERRHELEFFGQL